MKNVFGVVKRLCCSFKKRGVVAAALLLLLLPPVGLAAETGSQPAASDQSPLLEILISKGILTREEAIKIQQEVFKIQQQTAAQEEQKKEEMVKEVEEKAVPKALKGIKIEGLGYVDYSAGQQGQPGDTKSSFNRFDLTRGYLTVQDAIQPWLGARVTTDIYQENDTTAGNNGNGSWEPRLKYLYAELKPPDFSFITNMKSEFGLGHIPWLDFEEHVNPYRAQGTMPIERAGVLNSADVGISLQGNFAGKLADAEALTGNSSYDGRYGSWHVGVYNGGGYHASENNGNKVVEGRFTVRPLPDMLPGLQLSYFGLIGKGNVASNAPDYTVNLGMISYQNPSFILTAQYFATKGNAGGSWVDPANGDALKTAGYSFFGTYYLPVLDRKFSVFGRYDHFNNDDDNDVTNDATYNLYMFGLAYKIFKDNMVLADYEWANYGINSGGMTKTPVVGNDLGDDHRVQVVYQLAF
jgi:polyhydroxyalkanoate synthesis regulator phasin